MIYEVLFSGFGGQGVVTGALVLAHMCLNAGMNVTNVPQYGAEQRGGAASSDTKFAPEGEEIYDPRTEHPTVLIALTEAALATHARICSDGAIVLFNSNMGSVDPAQYPNLKVYSVPCLDLADQAGSVKSANFVMLGLAVRLAGWFDCAYCLEQIREYFHKNGKDKLIDWNIKAFEAGYQYEAAAE